jgi:hypothetical protein
MSRKASRIDPTQLGRPGLPNRIIDYVIALKPNNALKTAYRALPPLSVNTVKSWNHITKNVRDEPIAINIETKAPMKSWTDGKPQIGIWIAAWFRRCELLWETCHPGRSAGKQLVWPSVPILIAQGHDWHLLIATKEGTRLIFREKISAGSTRNVFDALKIVAVLHWLMNWAETVWRPWFMRLIADDNEPQIRQD